MFDSDTSPPQKNPPTMCRRTRSTASASTSRVAVSGRSVCENSARYGSEKRRCRVTSTGFSGLPSSSVRFEMTATGSTHGISSRCSMRSMSYSPLAISSVVSLIATTNPPRWAKRTRWREMPFGRAAIVSFGHDSSGRSHGRSRRAGSGNAEVIEREPLMGRSSQMAAHEASGCLMRRCAGAPHTEFRRSKGTQGRLGRMILTSVRSPETAKGWMSRETSRETTNAGRAEARPASSWSGVAQPMATRPPRRSPDSASNTCTWPGVAVR